MNRLLFEKRQRLENSATGDLLWTVEWPWITALVDQELDPTSRNSPALYHQPPRRKTADSSVVKTPGDNEQMDHYQVRR